LVTKINLNKILKKIDINEELNSPKVPSQSRDSRKSSKKTSKISNIIELNKTPNTVRNSGSNGNFNISQVLMEKLEKEGIISYESSPVNTDKNQEEDLQNDNDNTDNNLNKENNSTNLNVDFERENNTDTDISTKKNLKNISVENNLIGDEVRDSIFIETTVKNENRKSLFRGDIFDLAVEEDKKV